MNDMDHQTSSNIKHYTQHQLRMPIFWREEQIRLAVCDIKCELDMKGKRKLCLSLLGKESLYNTSNWPVHTIFGRNISLVIFNHQTSRKQLSKTFSTTHFLL